MAKLRLGSKEDIRLAIRRRGSQIAAKMTDKEIFGSEEFKNYITKLLDFILRKFKLYSLTLIHDESENGFTAFTDGKNITINTGNSLVRKPKLLERRFKVVMGMGFHEAAHKLFLDFTTHNKAMDQIQGGKLYGKFHTNGEPDLEKAREELEKVTASPYSSAIASIYANLSNIIADAHDENAMKKCYPGFVTECIETLGNVIMDQCLTLEEMVGKRWDAYSILCNLMLTYAKYGYCKEGTASPETEKYMDALRAMEPTIDEAVMTDSLKARYDQLNLLVLQLWPYIRDRLN